MSGNPRHSKPPNGPPDPTVPEQLAAAAQGEPAREVEKPGRNKSSQAEIDAPVLHDPAKSYGTAEDLDELAPEESHGSWADGKNGAVRNADPDHDSANDLEYDSGNDPAEDPEDGEISADEAQLSTPRGVRQDMGTIALEPIPADFSTGSRIAGQTERTLAGSGCADDLDQMSDAEIMQRAGAGDDACYEFLVRKYRWPIIGFMYRMVHNQAVAEELAQEVFLRVYRARSSYRAEARFSTWLYRIASNMVINHARDTKSERSSSSIYLDQGDEETGTRPDVADLRPLAEQDLLRDEKMRRIREHVAALPERQRMAVVMHKYQDMDYKQIGAVLKLSESATKSLLFRAYQTLRDRLKEFA